ncbi:MAG TPA: copper resistance protein CopC, partial [Dehalococcoidia bacterium]|nr:copper resistance protein CopC [Dehalococcoidia bacterium]
ALLLAVLLGLIAGSLPSLSSRVFAHANLARSEPSPNSVLEAPPEKVTIWFTEPLEPEFSQIRVLDVQGDPVDRGDSTVDRTDPTVMSVDLPHLPDGTYTVAWVNVSTVDSHRVRGSFVFAVGEPIGAVTLPVGTSDEPLLQSPLEPVLRWLALVGALMIFGGLVFELVVIRPSLQGRSSGENLRRLGGRISARSLKLQLLAIGLLLAASLGHLVIQTAAVHDVPLFEALGPLTISLVAGTDWGQLWLWRIGCWLALALIFGFFTMHPPEGSYDSKSEFARRPVRALALAAGLAMLLTFSLTSHGAATSQIRFAAVLNDYLHLLAAAIWVGGLFHLAPAIMVIMQGLTGTQRRGLLTRVVSRFSVLAILCTGTLIVTGLYSGWAQVTILQAVATPYGLTLVVKLLLIAPLLSLGALNLLWVKPRLARDDRAGQWLRRLVPGEVIFALLVLLAVGLLTSLEPARQVASREGIGQKTRLSFQDTVEGADIALAIEPGRVGPNQFTVSLKDRLGRPIDNATDVVLSLNFQDADLGKTTASARPTGEGIYVIDGLVLSIAGLWQVELVVLRPDAFDARTAFRFTVVPGGAGSSASIAPTAGTGKLLLGAELALLGTLFLATGIPLGGWRSRSGAAIMGAGLLSAMVGIVLVFGALGGASTPESIRNPFPSNAQSLESGQQVYAGNCQVCHGVGGQGDGPEAAGLDSPPLDLVVHVPLHPDGDLFHFIQDGISGTAMPAWRGKLTDAEIWHVVNYIKTFGPAQP